MERFGFFLTSAKNKYISTYENWTLKKLTKIKVENYIEGEKELVRTSK